MNSQQFDELILETINGFPSRRGIFNIASNDDLLDVLRVVDPSYIDVSYGYIDQVDKSKLRASLGRLVRDERIVRYGLGGRSKDVSWSSHAVAEERQQADRTENENVALRKIRAEKIISDLVEIGYDEAFIANNGYSVVIKVGVN